LNYAVRCVRSTRPDDKYASPLVKKYIKWGAGPRASQYLILAGRAGALLEGRPNVSFDDIRSAFPAVLRHRLLPNFSAQADKIGIDPIMDEILKKNA
ncbi:MAG TPA: AAA family ATPase, partial [Spirochaetia bacterium]|nr:AAA family ATPase [Spirochaetia bacterium]